MRGFLCVVATYAGVDEGEAEEVNYGEEGRWINCFDRVDEKSAD